jgi:class 3 adenylate cyclase
VESTDPRVRSLIQAGAKPDAAHAIGRLILEGSDEALCRINAFAFAEDHGLARSDAVDAFLFASKLGIFEMSWNITCPGCGGVLDESTTLRTMDIKADYPCSLCAARYEPSLDDLVEVSFTVSPAVRRISAHDPDSLPYWAYTRMLYFSSGLQLPTGAAYDEIARELTLADEEVPAGGRVVLSLQLPAEFLIVFDPVTHASVFLDVKGEPTRERQECAMVVTGTGPSHAKLELRPGPLRLSIENKSARRILPGVFRANDQLHHLLSSRRAFLTAKQLFTSQTFRDLYKTDTLDIDQRLKIASLTVLFTDLKGSTELYERVGDLVAFDIVRRHFHVLGDVVKERGGAVVKTIGDAVMATFPTPESGLAAALHMRRAMEAFNAERLKDSLTVKIGVHEGPCLAVMLNDRLDYFGQTVNIAARVQTLAPAHSIFTTEPVVGSPAVRRVLEEQRLVPVQQRALLKGISEELTVYEIPIAQRGNL